MDRVKVGDWFFVSYVYILSPFADIQVGRSVKIDHKGRQYLMEVTNKRLNGISGKVVEILDEVQELER